MTPRNIESTPQSAEGRMLRAGLRGNEAEWRRINDTEIADGAWCEVMPVAFAVAARMRFGWAGDRRMVTRFVDAVRRREPEGAGFPFRAAEAAIRGVLGEHWLLADTNPSMLGPLMYDLLFALVDDLALDDSGIDRLLVEAENELSVARAAIDVAGENGRNAPPCRLRHAPTHAPPLSGPGF